mgnify:CR=1 FL=1
MGLRQRLAGLTPSPRRPLTTGNVILLHFRRCRGRSGFFSECVGLGLRDGLRRGWRCLRCSSSSPCPSATYTSIMDRPRIRRPRRWRPAITPRPRKRTTPTTPAPSAFSTRCSARRRPPHRPFSHRRRFRTLPSRLARANGSGLCRVRLPSCPAHHPSPDTALSRSRCPPRSHVRDADPRRVVRGPSCQSGLFVRLCWVIRP